MSVARRRAFRPVGTDKYTFMSVQFREAARLRVSFATSYDLRTPPEDEISGAIDRRTRRALQLGWRKGVFVVDDNFIGITRRLWSSPRSGTVAAPQPLSVRFFTKLPLILLRGRHYWMRCQSKFLPCVHRIESPSGVAKETKKISESPRTHWTAYA